MRGLRTGAALSGGARGFIAPAGAAGTFGTIPLQPAPARADGDVRMVKPSAPMSNAERQRQFRKRNPGYYGRLHARRRAEGKALAAQRAAAEQLVAVRPAPLMLPAPVEVLLIPGMNVIAAAAAPAPEPLPVALPFARPISPSAKRPIAA
jgi:hypothetical protein